MSGAYIPYHLRPNKAVERGLFLDLLTRLNRYCKVSNYAYYGFGGPYLEDHKILHTQFGNKKLYSIEEDENVLNRQNFNKPFGNINCELVGSADFIERYNCECNSIIWLDYVRPKEILNQIQEFEALLPKLKVNDIVKVTVNANENCLFASSAKRPDGRNYNREEKQQKRFDKLKARISQYFPGDTDAGEMDRAGLPRVLMRAFELACSKGLNGNPDVYFQLLSCFVYADSDHQMMTFCGILLNKTERKTFFEKTEFSKWQDLVKVWGQYYRISVPALSAKEKLHIDSRLPNTQVRRVHDSLKFLFAEDKAESLEMIEFYKKYYRFYPSFHKVSL